VQGDASEVRPIGQKVVDADCPGPFEGIGGRHNPEVVLESEEFVVQGMDQVGFDYVLEDRVPDVVDLPQCVAHAGHCPSSCQSSPGT
jgi:hypothetical protein